MDNTIIGISITFVIISAMCLWYIILGKGYWWLKAIVVSVVLYFSLGLWHSVSSLSGWPTEQVLPEKFTVHWALVKEPSKLNTADSGSILMWASSIEEEEQNENHLFPFKIKKRKEPRVYKLPYSEQMHQKLAKAMQQIAQGKGVVGEKKGSGEKDGKGQGQAKAGKEGQKGYGSLSSEQDFIFYDLPPAILPSKD
jgi:hypothetical protein